MVKVVQQAPAETQIQMILESIAAIKEKIEGNKIILKEYKIKSPELDNLKKKRKDMTEMINEEKERIESELLEDSDYETAKNDDLTLKNELKEQKSMLAVALKNKNKIPGLQTEDIITKAGQMKLQLEFSAAIYIDGKLL